MAEIINLAERRVARAKRSANPFELYAAAFSAWALAYVTIVETLVGKRQ